MTKNNHKPIPPDPRGCAVRALEWVFGEHKSLDVFLEKDRRFAGLPTRDKALSRAIIGTTLRRLGQIDQIIDQLLTKPMPRQAITARQILRAGAAELLFLRSASYGVINSLVQLAGNFRGSRPYKGLINALLRRIDQDGTGWLENAPLALNIPIWPGKTWNEVYGPQTTQLAAMTLAEPAALDVTVFEDVEAWAQKLGGQRIGQQTVRLSHKGRIETLEGYDEGKWIVQDVSAALPVQILSPMPGENIADLCAAPGGKTVQLAWAGAQVTALDNQQARLARLHQNLLRTKQQATVICADARAWKPDQLFDAVLLDAPCSATGIFRHHPDVLYNRRAKDIGALAERQLALAINAAKLLKSGGRLVYCVCSAEKLEGEAVVEKLLQASDLVLQPIQPDEEALTNPFFSQNQFLSQGMIRIPPGAKQEQGGMDGFFIARLGKPQTH